MNTNFNPFDNSASKNQTTPTTNHTTNNLSPLPQLLLPNTNNNFPKPPPVKPLTKTLNPVLSSFPIKSNALTPTTTGGSNNNIPTTTFSGTPLPPPPFPNTTPLIIPKTPPTNHQNTPFPSTLPSPTTMGPGSIPKFPAFPTSNNSGTPTTTIQPPPTTMTIPKPKSPKRRGRKPKAKVTNTTTTNVPIASNTLTPTKPKVIKAPPLSSPPSSVTNNSYVIPPIASSFPETNLIGNGGMGSYLPIPSNPQDIFYFKKFLPLSIKEFPILYSIQQNEENMMLFQVEQLFQLFTHILTLEYIRKKQPIPHSIKTALGYFDELNTLKKKGILPNRYDKTVPSSSSTPPNYPHHHDKNSVMGSPSIIVPIASSSLFDPFNQMFETQNNTSSSLPTTNTNNLPNIPTSLNNLPPPPFPTNVIPPPVVGQRFVSPPPPSKASAIIMKEKKNNNIIPPISSITPVSNSSTESQSVPSLPTEILKSTKDNKTSPLPISQQALDKQFPVFPTSIPTNSSQQPIVTSTNQNGNTLTSITTNNHKSVKMEEDKKKREGEKRKSPPPEEDVITIDDDDDVSSKPPISTTQVTTNQVVTTSSTPSVVTTVSSSNIPKPIKKQKISADSYQLSKFRLKPLPNKRSNDFTLVGLEVASFMASNFPLANQIFSYLIDNSPSRLELPKPPTSNNVGQNEEKQQQEQKNEEEKKEIKSSSNASSSAEDDKLSILSSAALALCEDITIKTEGNNEKKEVTSSDSNIVEKEKFEEKREEEQKEGNTNTDEGNEVIQEEKSVQKVSNDDVIRQHIEEESMKDEDVIIPKTVETEVVEEEKLQQETAPQEIIEDDTEMTPVLAKDEKLIEKLEEMVTKENRIEEESTKDEEIIDNKENEDLEDDPLFSEVEQAKEDLSEDKGVSTENNFTTEAAITTSVEKEEINETTEAIPAGQNLSTLDYISSQESDVVILDEYEESVFTEKKLETTEDEVEVENKTIKESNLKEELFKSAESKQALSDITVLNISDEATPSLTPKITEEEKPIEDIKEDKMDVLPSSNSAMSMEENDKAMNEEEELSTKSDNAKTLTVDISLSPTTSSQNTEDKDDSPTITSGVRKRKFIKRDSTTPKKTTEKKSSSTKRKGRSDKSEESSTKKKKEEEDEVITIEDDDHVFLVEKLLEKKYMAKGEPMYLVKWQGYPDSENTWELESNIFDVNIINNFNGKVTYENAKAKKLQSQWDAKRKQRKI
ncbi:hypothetical protein ABK040_002667 [Willaertia magna]